MKRFIFLTILLSLMLILFVGCGGGYTRTDQDDPQIIRELIEYNNKHYVVVNTAQMSDKELEYYLNTMHNNGYRLVAGMGTYNRHRVILEKINKE